MDRLFILGIVFLLAVGVIISGLTRGLYMGILAKRIVAAILIMSGVVAALLFLVGWVGWESGQSGWMYAFAGIVLCIGVGSALCIVVGSEVLPIIFPSIRRFPSNKRSAYNRRFGQALANVDSLSALAELGATLQRQTPNIAGISEDIIQTIRGLSDKVKQALAADAPYTREIHLRGAIELANRLRNANGIVRDRAIDWLDLLDHALQDTRRGTQVSV